MTIKTLTRSYAGGEITPELFARIDLAKNQTGLRTCRNFEVLAHGPAQNRAGFEYVLETKDSTKESVLFPFIFSATQNYALEFGDLYMRIHTQGGTVLEAAQAITSATNANPGVFTKIAHGLTTGQWVYWSGVTGMSQLAGRFMKVVVINPNTFSLTDLAGVAFNTTALGVYTAGNAARVYEIATPYTEADVSNLELHYTQSQDVFTLVHPSYAVRELKRLGATNWTITAPAFTPTMTAPTNPTAVPLPVSGTDRTRYKLTSIATDGLEESLASRPALVGAGTAITGATNANPGVITSVAHGRAVGDAVYITGVGGMTQLTGEYLVDTVPTANTLTLKSLDGVVVDTTAYGVYTAGGTLYPTELINTLTVAGNKNTISWTVVAGAVRYNVYKYRNGLYGYIGQATGTSFVDDNIAPDISKTPPENDNPFGSADNYPGAVGYFTGRRWFAGTNNKQQNLWATRSGTESNMSYSIPTRDDDSIRVRLTSRQANRIRHIIPLSDLLLLTSGAEWKITALNSDAITPSSISYRPEDYIGASNLSPIVTSGAVLYAQDRGGRVREMRYKWEQQGYQTSDLSILAPHLFDDYTLVSCAWTRARVPIAWWVRDDGTLLGITYVPEHQVAGWHHHDTAGTFESVCAVPEGNEDALYAIVKRNVNGRNVRYVERKHTRTFDALEDCFFVDAGATYDGVPATTISNLWHLVGEEVAILADGAVQPAQTVSATATITLERQASKVHIGLGYTCDIETLPLATEALQAAGQGAMKNINKAFMRVYQSSGIHIGPSFDKLKEFKQRTSEPYGSPPALYDGIVPLMLTPTWQQDGSVCLRQPDPLPVTILSTTLEVAIGG